MARGVRGARAEWNVAEHDADLGFVVQAPRRIVELDRVARAEHVSRAALVDQRIGLERRRRLGAARAADEDDVVEVRRAVDPLEGARQRRAEPQRIDRDAIDRAAIELIGDHAQRRLGRAPVVERALQRRPGIGRRRADLGIAAHDQEAAVSRAIAQRRELHGLRDHHKPQSCAESTRIGSTGRG